MKAWSLEGKTAVVTGGSEGIGLAISQELLTLGASVLIVSRNEEKLQLARRTTGDHHRLSILAADLVTDAGRSKLTSFVTKLDILVNNLGAADRGSFVEMGSGRGSDQLSINLTANLELTRAFHPLLKASQGTVVNVGSVAGQRALPQRHWYGVAKAAVDASTKALAVEWGPEGIRVNAVAPWFTETPLTAPVLSNPATREKVLGLTPLRRIASPDDVAKAVAFLSMPAAAFINGVILAVDGGYLAQGGL